MMKAFSLLLIGGISAMMFSQSGQTVLNAHLKALQDAPSMTATLNVLPIGGAPAAWKIAYSRPNLLRIESPDGWTLSDGKTLYVFNKKDNAWTESPISDEAILKTSGLKEAFAWRAFFDKDAAKPILSTKIGANRIIKGVAVQELTLTMEGMSATLLIDPKLGYARGFTFKQGEIDLLVTSADIQIGKEPMAADAFAFQAPEGAKKVEAAAPAEGAGFAAVQALFNRTCMPCHSAARRSGGHNLTTYAGIARGVVAGSPGSSPIFMAISGNPPRMPQMRPGLSHAELELVSKWIEAGAKPN